MQLLVKNFNLLSLAVIYFISPISVMVEQTLQKTIHYFYSRIIEYEDDLDHNPDGSTNQTPSPWLTFIKP